VKLADVKNSGTTDIQSSTDSPHQQPYHSLPHTQEWDLESFTGFISFLPGDPTAAAAGIGEAWGETLQEWEL